MEENSPNVCPGYEIKTFDGEAPVLVLCEVWSTPLFIITPRSTLNRKVVPNRVPSVGYIELFNYFAMSKQMINV